MSELRFDTVVYEWDQAEAEAFFRYAGYKARNASEPLREAGRAIRREVDEAFRTEGESVGHPWADLKESYKPVKMARYKRSTPYPILHGKGTLRTKATLPSAVKVRSSADGGRLVYSVDSPYAEWQSTEQGITDVNAKGDISYYLKPARPFVVIHPELREEIEDGFRDWLDELKAANRSRRNTDMVNPFRGLSSWL